MDDSDLGNVPEVISLTNCLHNKLNQT